MHAGGPRDRRARGGPRDTRGRRSTRGTGGRRAHGGPKRHQRDRSANTGGSELAVRSEGSNVLGHDARVPVQRAPFFFCSLQILTQTPTTHPHPRYAPEFNHTVLCFSFMAVLVLAEGSGFESKNNRPPARCRYCVLHSTPCSRMLMHGARRPVAPLLRVSSFYFY